MARRFVILGSGPAGIRACESIRTVDTDAEIIVITAEADRYYSRPGLAYFLADEIPEASLFPFQPADMTRLGIEFVIGRAAQIDPVAHEVRLEDGRAVAYDRLLLAMGSQAIMPDLPGMDLSGVYKLDDIADARRLLAKSRKTSTAVVVGGASPRSRLPKGCTPGE